jgi:hypothetical protein
MFLQKILDATDARIRPKAHSAQSAKRPRAVRVPDAIPNQIGGRCPSQGQHGEERQVHAACASYGARRQQDWRSRYRDAELLGEHPEWQGYLAIADEIARSLGHGFYFWPLEKECRKRGFCYNTPRPFATVRQPYVRRSFLCEPCYPRPVKSAGSVPTIRQQAHTGYRD